MSGLRPLVWTAWVGLALLASLLVVPGLVDWEAHKGAVADSLTRIVGRAVHIDGPLEVALLPRPLVSAERLHLANAPGAPSPALLEVARIEATLSWSALLQGRLGIDRLTLDAPRVILERGADGAPNWQLPLLHSDTGDGGAAGPPLEVSRLEIRRGTVRIAEPVFGRALVVEELNLSGALDLAHGGLHLAGAAQIDQVAATLGLDLQFERPDRPPLALQVGLPGGRVALSGWPALRAGDPPAHGHVAVETESLPELSGSIARLAGLGPVRLDDSLGRRLTFGADVAVDGGRVALDGLALRLDDEIVRGELAVSLDGTPAVSGRLASPALDGDRWVRRLQAGSLLVAASGSPESAGETPALPPLRLHVAIDALRYRGDVVRDLAISFSLDDNVLHLQEVRVVLPGGLRVHRRAGLEGDDRHAGYDGEIEIEGSELRRTLKWIGIDTAGLPADRLQSLHLVGKTRPAHGRLRLTGATLRLDDLAGTATAEIAYGIPAVITATVHLPKLDLDAYALIGDAVRGLVGPTGAPAGAEGDSPPPPVFDIAATIDEAIYRGETARRVDARVVVQGNALRLRHVGVDELLGGHLEITGSVLDFGTAPSFDLAWRAVLHDADRMIDYAGLPRFRHGRIGPAQVAGRARGTLREAVLSDLSVAMLDATVQAEGRLAFGDAFAFDLRRFSLTAPDAARLHAAARGGDTRRGAAPSLGPLQAGGRLRGGLDDVEFRGDLVFDAVTASGVLGTTLGARPRFRASLQVPTSVRLDRWLPGGGEAGQSGGAGGPSGLAALRSLDASLDLQAAEVTWNGLSLRTAELSAELRHGVLDVRRLSGVVAGAVLELAATLDVRQAPPVLELGGRVRNIDLARSLALAGGENAFGSDQLAVALEGVANVEGLRLRAVGGTVEQLLDSAVGRGHLDGQIRPSVVRGSLSFASVATGIGRLFSSEMGFAAEVLGRFIGDWSSFAGELAIEGGRLSLSEHALRSRNATAYLTGAVDLRQGTVDSTIALDVGPTGYMDYVMSVGGPLDAPVLRNAPRR